MIGYIVVLFVGFWIGFIIADWMAVRGGQSKCERCQFLQLAKERRDADLAGYRHRMAEGDLSGVGRDPNLGEMGAEHNWEGGSHG